MANSDSQNQLLDQTWQSVRGLISKSLLADGELVSVPNLSTADCFGLYSVFVKSKSGTLGQKIKQSLEGPEYKVLGHLAQVANLEKTNVDNLLNSSKAHMEDTDQSKTWEGDVDLGSKSVHLTIEGLNKFLVPLSMKEGDLFLINNIPELIGAKSIYIITDVMKASDIKAVVTGDDDSWMRIKVGPLPIGFGYSKFRYTPEGLVGEQIKSKPCFHASWEVVIDRISHFLNKLSE